MGDGWEIDAAEVEGLRHEITNRISLMNALIALELAAVGTGLTISAHTVHVLSGMAAISSFLWLLWMDQSMSTRKLAAYLAIELAPRLGELAGRPILRWEYFLRQIESGGPGSARALRLYKDQARTEMTRSVRADWYVPLLFGCTPPVLLFLYALNGAREHVSPFAIVAAGVAATVIWIFALARFTDFVRNTKVLDRAIIAAGDRAAALAGKAAPAARPVALTNGIRPAFRRRLPGSRGAAGRRATGR